MIFFFRHALNRVTTEFETFPADHLSGSSMELCDEETALTHISVSGRVHM